MIWAQKTNNNVISNNNVTKNDILVYHLRDETAMLVCKTMAKGCASFA